MSPQDKPNTHIAIAQRTIDIEAQAVTNLSNKIGADFERACELLLATEGRIIITGMGKSGLIGRKIASTFASTGSPAFFVHPGEASHGDMGMITDSDTVVAISNSGNSSELIQLLPLFKRLNIPLISMTALPDSPLAQASHAWLDISVEQEACPLGLAPTSSTTVTLVTGDALAIALLEARGFSAEDFAFSHPGGSLGRKLLLKVEDLMHSGASLPQVSEHTTLTQALEEISRKGFGLTTICDDHGKLQGVFTDGDLRRCFDKDLNIKNTAIIEVMSRNPKTISAGMLAAEALRHMQDNKITALIVAEDDTAIGVLHMHDLLRAGVV